MLVFVVTGNSESTSCFVASPEISGVRPLGKLAKGAIYSCGFTFLSAMLFLEGKRVGCLVVSLCVVCHLQHNGVGSLCFAWFACGELELFVLLFRDPTSLAVQISEQIQLLPCLYAQRCVSISVKSSSVAVFLLLCTTSAPNPKFELRLDLGVLADLTTSECCVPVHWALIQ